MSIAEVQSQLIDVSQGLPTGNLQAAADAIEQQANALRSTMDGSNDDEVQTLIANLMQQHERVIEVQRALIGISDGVSSVAARL